METTQTNWTARRTRFALLAAVLLTGLLLACGGTSAVRPQPTSGATGASEGETPHSTAPPSAEVAAQATAVPTGPLTPAQIVQQLTPSTVLIRASFPSTIYSEQGLDQGLALCLRCHQRDCQLRGQKRYNG